MIFYFFLICLQEQHAQLSEAPNQAEEEERIPCVFLSVQLVLCIRTSRPPGPTSAQMGLWQTPRLMFTGQTNTTTHSIYLWNRFFLFTTHPCVPDKHH